MKKNTNFAFGFTIAELLITLLISALVAAAMVPVIGLKKVKFPVNRFNHGIAECYYAPTGFDSNGDATGWQLTFYTADNHRRGGNAGAGVAVNADHCTFTPPKAEYYEIIVIGAGTDGNQDDPVLPSDGIRLGNSFRPQPISTGNGFQSSLNDATLDLGDGEIRHVGNQLREILAAWNVSDRSDELFARYILEAPSGGSGRNQCNPVHLPDISSSHTEDGCSIPWYTRNVLLESAGQSWNDVPRDYCNAFVAHEGNPSGNGLRVEVQYNNINPNSNIVARAGADATVLSFNGQNFRLSAAGQGQTPNYDGMGGYRFPQAEAPRDATCTFNGQECVVDPLGQNLRTILRITELAPIPGNTAFQLNNTSCTPPPNGSHNGIIRYVYNAAGDSTTLEPSSVNDADISGLVWNYNPIVARVRSGYAGEPGEEKSVVYENLKSSLLMFPARPQTGLTSDEMGVNNSSFVMLPQEVSENPEDPQNVQPSILVSARSGQEHGRYDDMTFQMINSDIPIPRGPLHSAKTFDVDNFNYVAKLMTTPYRGGLRGCERDGEWCPGFAGKGIYFYLADVPDAAAISITNKINNQTFAVPTDQVRRDLVQREDFGMCDNRVTSPSYLANFPFANANGEPRDFTMQFCREGKSHGSPGAVIIMW